MSSSKVSLNHRNRNISLLKRIQMRFFSNVLDVKEFPWISKNAVTVGKFSVMTALMVLSTIFAQYAKLT